MAVNSRSMLEGGCFLRGLTFDMRGGRQPAKPDVARPLDGRVRPRLGACGKRKPQERHSTRVKASWDRQLRRLPGA